MLYRIHKQGYYRNKRWTGWTRDPAQACTMDHDTAQRVAAMLGGDAEPIDHDKRAALL